MTGGFRVPAYPKSPSWCCEGHNCHTRKEAGRGGRGGGGCLPWGSGPELRKARLVEKTHSQKILYYDKMARKTKNEKKITAQFDASRRGRKKAEPFSELELRKRREANWRTKIAKGMVNGMATKKKKKNPVYDAWL